VEEIKSVNTPKLPPTPYHEKLEGCPEGEVKAIVFYPNPSLKKPSENVPRGFAEDPEAKAELDKIIANMATTMYSVGGMGLSAVQIGIPLRIFIADVYANDLVENKSQLLVAINPEIEFTSTETSKDIEGCLSFPSANEHVVRPSTVGISGLNRDGTKFGIRAGGLFARIIQHEMDHLDGVVFIDRMGRLQKRRVRQKMSKFRRKMGRI